VPVHHLRRVALACCLALLVGACSSGDDSSSSPSTTSPTPPKTAATSEARCLTPPRNPFLADGAVPIGHVGPLRDLVDQLLLEPGDPAAEEGEGELAVRPRSRPGAQRPLGRHGSRLLVG
jgi:hypothetical protein